MDVASLERGCGGTIGTDCDALLNGVGLLAVADTYGVINSEAAEWGSSICILLYPTHSN